MDTDVIEDCINVFSNTEVLFRQRTNFGSRINSSLTLSNYRTFINDAIQRVQVDLPVDSDTWCEDAHFATISLLYDTVIFIYSVPNTQWFVFNEMASRGYICLLSVPGHFDVLLGIDAAPIVPTAAYTHGISCSAFHGSGDVWQHLQHNYCFQHVFYIPANLSGVTIVNSPLVPSTCTSKKTSEGDSESDSDNSPQSMKTVYTGDHPTCNYVNQKIVVQLLRTRCRSMHGNQVIYPNLAPGKLVMLNLIKLQNNGRMFILVTIVVPTLVAKPNNYVCTKSNFIQQKKMFLSHRNVTNL